MNETMQAELERLRAENERLRKEAADEARETEVLASRDIEIPDHH